MSEDTKEYTIQYKNDGYDIETKVHFKDVLGHSDAYWFNKKKEEERG